MTPFRTEEHIIWLKSAESTNKELRNRIEALDNLSVVAAFEQTAGRGQGSHSWHASPGKNISCSVLYRYYDMALAAVDSILITCVTTLALLDFLREKGVTARIKWPNDIWVGDRKICGILIENILEGRNVSSSIVGIGLNLNEKDWPSELPNPVSLQELTGEHYDICHELEVLLAHIAERYDKLASESGRQELREEFGKNMFRLDEERRL